MRSVRGIRGVLALLAPALLVAVVGVGCGGHKASSQELPDSSHPEARIVGDGLLPGDRRAPGVAPVTTTRPPPPIGRTSSPVPPPVPVITTTLTH